MNNIQHIKLNNGVNIFYYSNPLYTTSTGLIAINAGSYMEDKGVNNGWSHFMEHMLFKKSESWSTRNRMNKFSENGVDWNGFTSNDEIYFYFNCPNRYYEKTFDMYLDMIFRPVFDENELSVEREVVIAEMKQSHSKDYIRCYRIFKNHAYGKKSINSFFTNDTYGIIEDLQKCNSKSLRKFYDRYIDARNITFIMTGPPRDYDKFVRKIEALDLKQNKYDIVSKVKNRVNKAQKFNIKSGCNVFTKEERESALIFIWRGAPTALECQKNDLIPYITNVYQLHIGNGPNSFLWNVLREEKGYLYSINMYKEINPYESYQFIVSDIDDTKIEPFIRDLFQSLDTFNEKGIDKSVFNRLIKGIKNEYCFDKNNSLTMAEKIHSDFNLGIKPKTMKERYDSYNRITRKDLIDFHRRYLNTHYSYVSASCIESKCKDLENALSKYNVVFK